MNFQIKNRFTGVVQFECELSAEVAGQEYRFQLGFAVRKAVEARANLADANLAGAYLAGANLAGANLARANLAGANLADANLAGANLAGAYLAGAYLAGANLAGAKVRDNLTLIGKRPFFQIGLIGSRNDVLLAYTTESGLRLQAGCFWGTAEEFRKQLADTHANNEHAQEYSAALLLIEKHAELWAPTEIKEKAA